MAYLQVSLTLQEFQTLSDTLAISSFWTDRKVNSQIRDSDIQFLEWQGGNFPYIRDGRGWVSIISPSLVGNQHQTLQMRSPDQIVKRDM